jgi:hypothetical protein
MAILRNKLKLRVSINFNFKKFLIGTRICILVYWIWIVVKIVKIFNLIYLKKWFQNMRRSFLSYFWKCLANEIY